jgi:hypothetical protein
MSETLHLNFTKKHLRKDMAHCCSTDTNIIIIGTSHYIIDITERVIQNFCIVTRIKGVTFRRGLFGLAD